MSRSGRYPGAFFSQIAQEALDIQDCHIKDKKARHITRDLHQIRQILLIAKICLRRRQCQDDNKRRLGYGVHWAVNESEEGYIGS